MTPPAGDMKASAGSFPPHPVTLEAGPVPPLLGAAGLEHGTSFFSLVLHTRLTYLACLCQIVNKEGSLFESSRRLVATG